MAAVTRLAAQKEFIVDGDRFNDFAGFVSEFNRGFIAHVGGDWSGNLDAFSDYFSWAEQRCTIRWVNSNKSRGDLGHAAMARWLENNLTRCHPSNRRSVRKRLVIARSGEGITLFEWLVEIIEYNGEFVDLVLD